MNKSWREMQKEMKRDRKEKLFNAKMEIEMALDNVRKMEEKDLFQYPLWERWGRGNRLYNFFWWDIKIETSYLQEMLRRKNNEYTDILFLPYKITNEEMSVLVSNCMDSGQECVLNEKYWGVKDYYPHLDFMTGNIHKEFNAKSWDGKIKQVVLAKKGFNSHLGPRYAYKIGTWKPVEISGNDFVIYERKNKIKDEVTKIAVPKVCYYPILTGQECEEDKTVEELLKGLLKNILR